MFQINVEIQNTHKIVCADYFNLSTVHSHILYVEQTNKCILCAFVRLLYI
jgi:hypothetical protein